MKLARNEYAFEARYLLVALIVGAMVGMVGSYFHLAIDVLSKWPAWVAGYLDGWQRVVAGALVTMTCSVGVLWLVRRFAPEAGGSGVQEIEGAMMDKREVRWRRVLPVKVFGGILSISSGLVLGREGPTIHIGASIAQAVSEKLRIVADDRKGLLAAGAAAGLACAFNAPIASVLFVLEEMRAEFPYASRRYLAVAGACLTATIATQWIGGTAPDLRVVYEGGSVALQWLPVFVLLGGGIGLLGVGLNAGLLRMADFGAACHARVPYAYVGVLGLCVGAVLMSFPAAVTGGESLVRHLGSASPSLMFLLGLVALRFLFTVSSYASGVPGGIFAPILALGMCCGVLVGEALVWMVPEGGIHPVALGVAAMGGLFSASVHAPLVGIVLIAELTGHYDLLLSLAITCFTAYLVARWMGGRPIYEALLERTLEKAAQEGREA